jgi:hypothetical protein
VQYYTNNLVLSDLAVRVKRAPTHGDIDNRPFPINRIANERNRELCGYPFVFAPVFFQSLVANSKLERAKAVPAKLTPKGINIKNAQQPLFDPTPGYAFDVFPAARRTG